MDLTEPGGQDAAAGHAEQQAAGGDEEAVGTGAHGAEHGHGQHDGAELAEGHGGHFTGAPGGAAGGALGVELGQQFRIRHGHAHGEHHHGIQEHAAEDGDDHDVAGTGRIEGEFFSSLGHGIEAHEQEGRDGEDQQHAGDHAALVGEGGAQVGHAGGTGPGCRRSA